MPDLVEQMYCSQQIHIPPTFPYILKQYAKAAIRTQPYDLLRWSAAYFRAMAQGEEPPVKRRLEYPPVDTPSGLSPGYLKVLLKQIGNVDTVPSEVLYEKWRGVCLDENALTVMIKLGGFEENVEWMKFIAIAAGHLTNSLTQTMYLICELLTEEPEGGSDMIPLETFRELYTYLAAMDCGSYEEGEQKPAEEGQNYSEEENIDSSGDKPAEDKIEEENRSAEEKADSNGDEPADDKTDGSSANIPGIGPIIPLKQVEAVMKYLEYWADRQSGMVMPRNVHHFLCPSLDRVPLPE